MVTKKGLGIVIATAKKLGVDFNKLEGDKIYYGEFYTNDDESYLKVLDLLEAAGARQCVTTLVSTGRFILVPLDQIKEDE